MVILENIDIDINIDKAILQNIDIDKILNRFKFGISNRATPHPQRLPATPDTLLWSRPDHIRLVAVVCCGHANGILTCFVAKWYIGAIFKRRKLSSFGWIITYIGMMVMVIVMVMVMVMVAILAA